MGGVALGRAPDFGSRLFSDSHGDGELTMGHFGTVAEAERDKNIEAECFSAELASRMP